MAYSEQVLHRARARLEQAKAEREQENAAHRADAYARYPRLAEIDNELRRTLEGNEKISVNMAAMLTALNFCDECTKATDAADNLRSQLKVYLEDIAKLKSANDDSRREIAKLYSEIQSLKLQLARNGNA